MTIASLSKERLWMCDSECVRTAVKVVPKVLKVPVMVMVFRNYILSMVA